MIKILTEGCKEGNCPDYDGADVVVDAGLECLEDVDSLEHDDEDAAPLLH